MFPVVAKKKAPSKSMMKNNEDIKNSGFAGPLLPRMHTKIALKVSEKNEKRSD